MGVEKGFGGLLPGVSKIVDILEEVGVGGGKGVSLRWWISLGSERLYTDVF